MYVYSMWWKVNNFTTVASNCMYVYIMCKAGIYICVCSYYGGPSSEDPKKCVFLFVMPLMNKGMTIQYC